MRIFYYTLFILHFTLTLSAERPQPNLGRILFNEDGDYTYVGKTPGEWRANLSKMLNGLRDIPAQTLAYQISSGSDMLLYPSKAGSSWGWRHVEIPEGNMKKRWAAFPRAVRGGHDGVRWAAEDARRLGIAFIPVFRMNDAHYVTGLRPWLEGEFWTKYRSKYTFGKPPYPLPVWTNYRYEELLDFSHREVREHRLGVIREAIERYADVLDGFLLDFMRWPLFFPLEDSPQKAPLMTEFLMQVRASLDNIEAVRGRPIPLIVRVPATIKNCEKIGLNIRAWMTQGIIQAVIPAQLMVLAHDNPVYEYVALAKPLGIKVYYSIMSHYARTYAFNKKAPEKNDYIGPRPNAALLRGAAINYLSLSVDGFELYNYDLPILPADLPGLQGFLGGKGNLSGARTYAVTPPHSFDGSASHESSRHVDANEPPKQVPLALAGEDRTSTIDLFIGEDPKLIAPGSYVGLRIGFSSDHHSPPVTICINDINIPADGDHSTSRPGRSNTPRYYYQMRIQNPGLMLRQGWNAVRISARDTSARQIIVAEIQLGIVPNTTETSK